MSIFLPLPARLRPLLLVFACLPALAYPAWRHWFPAVAAGDWTYRVWAADIPRVSALLVGTDGELTFSQEFDDDKGSLARRDSSGGRHVLLEGLFKPDGLAAYQGGMAVGQEGGRHSVLLLKGGQARSLFEAENVEGLASDKRYLYAIEDKKAGRLLRYDAHTGQLATLREGLDEGEAVTVCADGRLYYTEKKKGWVKQWQASGEDRLVQAGLNAPGFLLCDAAGLWITEDATHMARVLLLPPTGPLQVVLEHLRSAQSLVALAPGHYLLAEQGRNRILEINRSGS
ncbi:MAG: hypothetical protein ABWY06_08810 [Pseudomonas sp.]|uniref:hypothetical protein n=1 Tax=Pseudomonas sp. TaxID=306 RepID=UPI00339900CD